MDYTCKSISLVPGKEYKVGDEMGINIIHHYQDDLSLRGKITQIRQPNISWIHYTFEYDDPNDKDVKSKSNFALATGL